MERDIFRESREERQYRDALEMCDQDPALREFMIFGPGWNVTCLNTDGFIIKKKKSSQKRVEVDERPYAKRCVRLIQELKQILSSPDLAYLGEVRIATFREGEELARSGNRWQLRALVEQYRSMHPKRTASSKRGKTSSCGSKAEDVGPE
jgi:hypothetical protein